MYGILRIHNNTSTPITPKHHTSNLVKHSIRYKDTLTHHITISVTLFATTSEPQLQSHNRKATNRELKNLHKARQSIAFNL